MDPKKVQTVLDWQALRMEKQLQSFLRFTNFYRQFIPSFAQIALPLTDLLQTKSSHTKPWPSQQLTWTPACQHAFENLKTLFSREPILKHPNIAVPFVVQTDASDVAVGAVLLHGNGCQILKHPPPGTRRVYSHFPRLPRRGVPKTGLAKSLPQRAQVEDRWHNSILALYQLSVIVPSTPGTSIQTQGVESWPGSPLVLSTPSCATSDRR